MVEQVVTIQNVTGLHARPASAFVQAAGKFASKIRLATATKEVDAKSILAVLGLGAKQGATLTIRAEGPDEADALTRLVGLFQAGFGEG